MKFASSLAAAAALGLACISTPAEAPPSVAARVIVGYAAGGELARAHPVSRGDDAPRARSAYQARADRLAQRAGIGLTVGRMVGDRAHVVMARGLSSEQLAERLAADPRLAYAVPDRRWRARLVPNDPLYARGPLSGDGPDVGQWYLRAPTDLFRSAVNAEAAWDRTTGLASVVVAVLDTGILFDHIDFDGRLLAGYDMIADLNYANDGSGRDAFAADPGDWITAGENARGVFQGCGVEDSSWHGTQMASVIGAAAANNGLGMAGIAHNARIMPVRVLGKCGGFESDIAAGMLWAAGIAQPGLPGSTTPAKVINMSLGGGPGEACSPLYRDAAAQATAAGAIIFAAAGNSTGRAVSAPANCPDVVAVTGLRHAGTKVGLSDLGPEIAIAAPGGNCINIDPGEPCLYPILAASNTGLTAPNAGGSKFTDSFDASIGTSLATAITSGVAALVVSARPGLTPAEVKDVLQRSARVFPTSGADNGPDDPTPVTACRAPDGTDQLQCYCSTGLCGAGMLDAAAAVAAAQGGLFARVDVSPATPVAGSSVTLSGAGSLVGSGRSVVSHQWALVNGGGIASGFSGATNAANAALLPSAAGTVVVRLTVTDDLGATSTAERSITVAAAPVINPPAGGGGSSGGGSSSPAWLLLLALAGCALRRAGPPRNQV
jgi:serine protease